MKKYIYYFVLIALIAIAASYLASAFPDGLEFVAEKLGFISAAVEHSSVMTDYTMPMLGETSFSTAVSGLIGVGLCFGAFWVISRSLPFSSRN
ncbi:MAG: PDGLE domain-containing protein [Candidatus Margulisbacteria bacterium]|nr:PDGLE domain-containing protein [Candidatus Margulisiibacteriota bacterium]